jgi:hypothetical protein
LKNHLFSCLLIFALIATAASRASAGDAETSSSSSAGPEGVIKHFGFVAKVSSLGVGGDVGVSFTRLANVRVGFNALDFSQNFRSNGIQYNGTLHFRSAEALLDVTPLGDWFHISPGFLFYNGNQITARANVPGGQNFDLGNVSFRSSPTDPVHGTGVLGVNKAAPMVMFGFGSPIPHHHHISIVQDFGVVFQGTPKTTLSLAGTACDPVTGLACVNAATNPTVQAQVQAEQARINKDTSIVKFYPVATLGIGFRF